MNVQTFWLEKTDRVRVCLRRFGGNCSGPAGYCNAFVVIHDNVPEAEWPCSGDDEERVPHDDARWPTACDACGASFTDDHKWQIFLKHLYRGPGGEMHTLIDAPAGAMWDADWMPDRYRGPDGIHLVVKLPNGHEWLADGPAANGPGWTRTGDPRQANVTASPSIGCPWPPSSPRYYHGWLRDGVLVEC